MRTLQCLMSGLRCMMFDRTQRFLAIATMLMLLAGIACLVLAAAGW